VVKRNKNGIVSPLIEVRTSKLGEFFGGVATKLRIVVRDARIIISRSVIDLRIAERLKRIRDKVKAGLPFSTLSLFHGGGICDKALHSGLQKSGSSSYVKLGVELESRFIESSLRNNPEIWRPESIAITGDIRDINLVECGQQTADIAVLGIPCKSASVAGRAKKKIPMPEADPDVGAMFHYALRFVEVFNPAIVFIENVKPYASTASMHVIRSVLTHMGYTLHERVLHGGDYALEQRDRLVVVAITNGLGESFSFDHLVALQPKPEKLKDVLEDVAPDSTRWKDYVYLQEKEKRDIAAGKTFYRQLLTGDESGCGTIGAGYWRHQSTAPYILHPDGVKSRPLSCPEHAAVKAIPVAAIAGNSSCTAHEIMGNSVVFTLIEALGFLIGSMLQYDLNFGGLTSYCQQVCGGGNCGYGRLCQFGVDAQTQMPDFGAWIAAHSEDARQAA
jgi:DNA (cytosine-5)-methyltransferase 1